MAERMTIVVPRIDMGSLDITLVGDSPLICHRWSTKAREMIRKKHMQEPKPPKEAKDPQKEYEESLYPLADGSGYGFPCLAFKNAVVSACRFTDGIPMTLMRGVVHPVGELVKIDGEPRIRDDMVRIGMGKPDLRYRAEFQKWRVTLTVAYARAMISPAQIVNLFNLAGFGIGVGEWRPERNGTFGRFHVLMDREFPDTTTGPPVKIAAADEPARPAPRRRKPA